MSEERWEIPDEWNWSTIGEACQVNQRDTKLRELPDDLLVSFVPMAAVDAEYGAIATPEARPLGKVRKGFTPFADGDVIFAKITPCMENGKAAIAHDLTNGLGFGSTEFHVMRPTDGILPEWVFYFVRREAFRNEAKSNFAGTAGQLRVPFEFIRNAPIPRAPLAEQRRIVAKIERLFEQSRTAREALDGVPALLKRFRQSVLAEAFRGELTERDPNDEPASVLLERIQTKRRRKWEEDLQGKGPKKARYVEPEPSDTSDLPELPEGWCWANVRVAAESTQYGYTQTSSMEKVGPHYLRITDIQDDQVDWNTVPYCEIEPDDEPRYLLKPGDIVFARSGATAGKSFLIRECPRAVFASYLIRVQTFPEIEPQYLFAFFHSKSYWDQVVTRGNAQPNANAQVLGAVCFPLAPLAEQRRIVARVEALFAQADAVEREVEVARRRAEKVDQAILARAFQGKLVPQNPDDEPVSVLLDRIQQEREQTAREAQEARRVRTVRKKTSEIEANVRAPNELTELLERLQRKSHNPVLPETLWSESGLGIDDFYYHLKQEVTAGRIRERRRGQEVHLEVSP